MKTATIPLLLCAHSALAHAPDSDATFVEAARHVLLGGHHLSLTILAMGTVAALVYALRRRRQRTPSRH